MMVHAVVVRLPELENGVRHRHPIAVEHAAVHVDPLTARVVARKRVAHRIGPKKAVVEKWPHGLRRRQRARGEPGTHVPLSNVVAAAPPTTMSHRQPSAHSACVTSWS